LKRLGDKRLTLKPESAPILATQKNDGWLILAIWNCTGEKDTGKARRFRIEKLRSDSKPRTEFVSVKDPELELQPNELRVILLFKNPPVKSWRELPSRHFRFLLSFVVFQTQKGKRPGRLLFQGVS